MSFHISLLLFSLFISVQSQQDTPISRFQNYLRINTAHPNPNYTAAINFLKAQSHSISNLKFQTLHLSPNKPLLLLSLPGTNPNLPSILFNSHLDSVPAEPSKWTHHPFAAVHTAAGEIFARGAQDDKCIGLQYLEALKNLQKDPDFKPVRTIHVVYVPDEEIGGVDGMAKFVVSKEFEELNVGFVLDEGQASTNDEFRVFYADRSPWNLVIKASGVPGHGSKMFDNSAMENLMKSIEVISKFRENQFDVVKAGSAMNSEVISVNPVYLKAGIPAPTPTGFVINIQPSEAEAGFDVRLPPTTDPVLLKKRIAHEWAPVTRNMTFEITEKGPLRDYLGRPLATVANESNPWWLVFEQAILNVGEKLSKPEILASTTDARFMRQKGIPTLGFSPMKNTPILLHDHNEFLKDTVYLNGIKVYESIIKALSSADFEVQIEPGLRRLEGRVSSLALSLHSSVRRFSALTAKQFQSAKNKTIRKLITMRHTNGRQGNAQVRDDMTKVNGGVKSTRKALYAETHTRKDGKYSSDSIAKVVTDMEAVEEQYSELKEKGSPSKEEKDMSSFE